jgi:hypothetical protein
MTTQFKVNTDGSIEGLRVVGFHGTVLADETPARAEPIFADAADHLVAIERVEKDAAIVSVSEAAYPERDPLPGDATRLPPRPAFRDRVCFVLGSMEREHVRKLERRLDDDSLRVPVRALTGGDVPSFATRIGGTIVLYVQVADVVRLRDAIRTTAREEATRPRIGADLARAAWWLMRTSRDETDRLIAAAALRRAGDRHWSRVAQRARPGVEPTELNKQIDAIERYYLPNAALPPELAGPRQRLRKAGMIPRQAA